MNTTKKMFKSVLTILKSLLRKEESEPFFYQQAKELFESKGGYSV